MALEQAGVSLEAEGFRPYLKKLDEIDKRNKAVFDAEFKGTGKTLAQVEAAARKYQQELKNTVREQEKAEKEARRLGEVQEKAAEKAARAQRKAAKEAEKAAAAQREAAKRLNKAIGVGLVGAAIAATAAVLELGKAAARVFIDLSKRGIELNQGIEDTEKIFSNLFKDQSLAEATVANIREMAAVFRVAEKDAISFGQSILPRTSNLDTFNELLRLTDIQADVSGKSFSELGFSIKEALSGDFRSLKEQFDVGPTVINRIKELAPAIGQDAALAQALGEEFERLGKTDLTGTLTVGLKDLETQANNLNTLFGEPIFDQSKIQVQGLIDALDRNQEGLGRTATAFGLVASNVIELVGTELISFLDSLNFASIEQGVSSLNNFVSSLRITTTALREAFQTGVLQTAFGLITRNTKQIAIGFAKIKQADFGASFTRINDAIIDTSRREKEFAQSINDTSNAQKGATDAQKAAINAQLAQNAALVKGQQEVLALKNALQQAEKLQLSFARAAENAARQLARQQEDVTRDQNRNIAKLGQKQAKDREKLLKNQQKRLDEFEKDRTKQVGKAEKDIAKERKKAADDRLKAQKDLQQKLQQQADKFRLSQLQGERRFALAERRLRAEGDILGLQQLREDRELQLQEEKENFGQQQKETKVAGKDQIKEQEKVSSDRLNEIKSGLEDQRAELLADFDRQLADQQIAQSEQKADLQLRFQEQAQDRRIALQRQEEDRRISQARQLEDLGRSLAQQEAVTEEGATKIAGELEKVFGLQGVASNIMTGFTSQTESKFTSLFENVSRIISDTQQLTSQLDTTTGLPQIAGMTRRRRRLGGVQEFDDGGVVQGPTGSPQPVIAHGGETFLPTHKQSFTMNAPVIPSQDLNVNMSGGFDITGGEQAGEEVVQAAVTEMTESLEIAIRRLARRRN